MCKNRWVRLSRGGKTCYAQWEDVGPFVSDDAAYVNGHTLSADGGFLAAGMIARDVAG